MNEDNLFHRVGLPKLMALSQGSKTIKVALVDGPLDIGHPAFGQILWKRQAACRNPASLACGHGTFVGGVLAFICPQCTFLARPIFCEETDFNRCPLVTTADLAKALVAVIDDGADIVNLSVGLKDHAEFYAAPLRRVYDYARERGVLIVGAAGNQGIDGVNPLFAHDWVISVGAAGPDGLPVETSNRDAAGLLAPGLEVQGLAAGGGTQRMSGTSVATPFVTGTLALLKALFPAATAEELRSAVLGPRRTGAVSPAAPPLLNAHKAYLNLLELYPNQPRVRQIMDSQQMAHEQSNSTLVDTSPSLGQVETNGMPQKTQVVPQSCGCGGSDPSQCSCKDKTIMPMSRGGGYVYALGAIRPVFPDEGLKKEFEFAAMSMKVSETDYYKVFSYQEANSGFRKYQYIAEQVVWVMDIAETDTYIVAPRSNYELGELIKSLEVKTTTMEDDLHLLIGIVGPTSSPEQTGGLQLPIVLCNQLFYSSLGDLAAHIKEKNGVQYDSIRGVIKAIGLKPNPGDTDERRAMNYIAFRYPEIYSKSADVGDKGYSLINIKTESLEGAGGRRLVDVIFNFQQNEPPGAPKSFYTRVDATGQFPFISAKLPEYIPTTA